MHFIDLAAQQTLIRARVERRFMDVLNHGKYIMGPEIDELEQELSKFCGAKHSLSCSNGTDALMLALMALGVRGGHAVFCPSFTFAATAEVLPCMGAVPIFVDIDPETFNMDPESLKEGIKTAEAMGLDAVGVIAVDLFGLPADYDEIIAIANEHGMWTMSDTAQGFGALYKGKRTGSIGTIATTSFFPAKPLGCYGDGGAVFTEDDELAHLIKSYRVHGQGVDKYDNVRIGINGRLDTIQAAVLLEKLELYPNEIDQRQVVAQRYFDHLSDDLGRPHVPEHKQSVWAQYTVKLPRTADRSTVQAELKAKGIPTAVYYPIPIHQATAYNKFPTATNGPLPVTEELSACVLSLPMHPYLQEDQQDKVIDALNEAIKA